MTPLPYHPIEETGDATLRIDLHANNRVVVLLKEQAPEADV